MRKKNACRFNSGSSAFILKEFHSKKMDTIYFRRKKDHFPAVTKDKASEENGLQKKNKLRHFLIKFQVVSRMKNVFLIISSK